MKLASRWKAQDEILYSPFNVKSLFTSDRSDVAANKGRERRRCLMSFSSISAHSHFFCFLFVFSRGFYWHFSACWFLWQQKGNLLKLWNPCQHISNIYKTVLVQRSVAECCCRQDGWEGSQSEYIDILNHKMDLMQLLKLHCALKDEHGEYFDPTWFAVIVITCRSSNWWGFQLNKHTERK